MVGVQVDAIAPIERAERIAELSGVSIGIRVAAVPIAEGALIGQRHRQEGLRLGDEAHASALGQAPVAENADELVERPHPKANLQLADRRARRGMVPPEQDDIGGRLVKVAPRCRTRGC